MRSVCYARYLHPTPPAPALPARLTWQDAGFPQGAHWRSPEPAGPSLSHTRRKRSRAQGHAHVITQVPSARDLLLLNNTFDVLPRSRKVECTDARCDHISLRETAALGVCPGDRQLPSPPLRRGGATHPGPLFVPPVSTKSIYKFWLPSVRYEAGGFGSPASRLVAPRRRPAEDPRLLDAQGPPCEAGMPKAGYCPGRNLTTRARIPPDSF